MRKKKTVLLLSLWLRASANSMHLRTKLNLKNVSKVANFNLRIAVTPVEQNILNSPYVYSDNKLQYQK